MPRELRRGKRTCAGESQRQHQLIRQVFSRGGTGYQIRSGLPHRVLRDALGGDAESAKCAEELRNLVAFDLDENDVSWSWRFLCLEDSSVRAELHHVSNGFELANGNLSGQVRNDRGCAFGADFSAAFNRQRAQDRARRDLGNDAAAARRIEPVAFQFE